MSPNTLRDLQLPFRDPRKAKLVREWYPHLIDLLDRVCKADETELPNIRRRYAEITGGVSVKSIDFYRDRLRGSAITVRIAAIEILESVSRLSFASIVRYLEPSAASGVSSLAATKSRGASPASESAVAGFLVTLYFEEFRLKNGYAWRMLQVESTDTQSQITFSHPELYQDRMRLRAFRRLLAGIEHMRLACQGQKTFYIDLNAQPSPNRRNSRKQPTEVGVFFQELQNGYAWSMWQVEQTKQSKSETENLKTIDLPLPEVYIDRRRIRALGRLLVAIEKLRRTRRTRIWIKLSWSHPFDENPEASKH